MDLNFRSGLFSNTISTRTIALVKEHNTYKKSENYSKENKYELEEVKNDFEIIKNHLKKIKLDLEENQKKVIGDFCRLQENKVSKYAIYSQFDSETSGRARELETIAGECYGNDASLVIKYLEGRVEAVVDKYKNKYACNSIIGAQKAVKSVKNEFGQVQKNLAKRQREITENLIDMQKNKVLKYDLNKRYYSEEDGKKARKLNDIASKCYGYDAPEVIKYFEEIIEELDKKIKFGGENASSIIGKIEIISIILNDYEELENREWEYQLERNTYRLGKKKINKINDLLELEESKLRDDKRSNEERKRQNDKLSNEESKCQYDKISNELNRKIEELSNITHNCYNLFYDMPQIINLLEERIKELGDMAKEKEDDPFIKGKLEIAKYIKNQFENIQNSRVETEKIDYEKIKKIKALFQLERSKLDSKYFDYDSKEAGQKEMLKEIEHYCDHKLDYSITEAINYLDRRIKYLNKMTKCFKDNISLTGGIEMARNIKNKLEQIQKNQ